MLVPFVGEVYVDTHVQVDLDDVLCECWAKLEGLGEEEKRPAFQVIDTATKLLASVPLRVVRGTPANVADEVIRRLETELARWQAEVKREER